MVAISIAEWHLKDDWGFTEKPDQDEYTVYMKTLLVCAKGDGVLSPEERNWVLGYCAANGGGAQLVEELAAYPADDDIRELITGQTPVAYASRRTLVYDALRASDADGVLDPRELAAIKRAATELEVPEDVVDRLYDLYKQEKAIKQARIALVWPAGVPI